MAKVVLIGLEKTAAHQIGRALQNDNHVVETKPLSASDREVLDADIVFVAGEGKSWAPLLRRVRQQNPGMPFIVVTRVPETSDWLDALEAGATDYCSGPFEAHQLRWLMDSALPRAARETARAAA